MIKALYISENKQYLIIIVIQIIDVLGTNNMKKQRYRLGDICTIVSGSTPKTNVPEYWDGDKKWITPAEISEDSYVIHDTERKITELAVKKTGLILFPKGTVLLSSRAPIGKVAIAGCEMYCNQGFKNLICSDVIDERYLYWYLKAKKDFLISLGRGATFKEISKSIVSEIEIEIHTRKQQHQIVQVLDQVTAIKAARQKQLDALDELVKARFIEMFGDINVNNKRWRSQPLGELCSIVRGGSPRPIEKYLGGTIPWIKIGDATKGDNVYIYGTKEHIIPEGVNRSRLVKKGSLIFANCGVSLGFARIIKFDGCIHDGWLALEDITPSLNKVFLLYAINQMTSYFRKIAPAGTQPNLNTSIMKAHQQIIPPLELQEKYISFVKQVNKTERMLNESLAETETLFQSLMQEYFG